MPAFLDLASQRFGRLQVQRRADNVRVGESRSVVAWECLCDCGRTVTLAASNLRNGSTKSCGCFRREDRALRSRTHGHTIGGKTSREFNAWRAMLDRCYRAKCKEYRYYGARGITVCDRWHTSFEAFFADMGRCPSGLTLDRADTNGNYEPLNCRWASATVQSANRRNMRLVMVGGERMSVSEAAKRAGVSRVTLQRRINRGMSIDEAIETTRNGLPKRPPRMTCQRGHAQTPENVYVRPDGARQCFACIQAINKRRWSEHKRQHQR